MSNLFTRLYLKFTIALVTLLCAITVVVYGYGYLKLREFVLHSTQPVAQLAAETWVSLPEGEQNNWLALMSTLSGTQWQIAEQTLTQLLKINQLNVVEGRATVFVKLDDQHSIKIRIENWSEWHKLHGWLALNAISDVTAGFREAKFQTIKMRSPWPMERVDRDAQALNALSLRQLTNGQSLRISSEDGLSSLYFFPAGARQVLRIGPIPNFTLLSPIQWGLTLMLSLFILGLVFALLVRPIQRRFNAILHSVDAINDDSSDVNLPTTYQDNFGHLARHIETMTQRLIHQLKLNKQLNQAVSHDLKTPLARIQFSLALLPADANDPYLVQIQQDVNLLTALTNELLLYHQLKHSTPTNAHCHPLRELQQSVSAVASNADIQLDLPEQDIELPIMATHWRRLTDNLLKNALQYGHGKIKVVVRFGESSVQLSIHDNGQGLTPEQFDWLKQPFQRQQDHRNLNENNHGLGLALVDATVNHYQGTFSLRPSPLGGAEFYVELPFPNNVALEL